MINKIKIEQLVSLSFLVIFGCFAITIIFHRSMEKTFIEHTEQVSQAFEVEADLERLQNILLGLEKGQWLYLLTGDADRLQPYRTAEMQIDNILNEIESDIVDGEQKKKIAEIKNLAKLQIIEMKETIDRFQEVNKQTNVNSEILQQFISTDRLVNRINLTGKIDEMIEAEQKILKQRQQEVDVAKENAAKAIFGGMAFVLLLGIAISYFLIMTMRRKEKTVNEVVNIIANSSTEIAATVEEQERVSAHQASSVNQTTTTINELAASSNHIAEQIDLSSQNANRVLSLAESSTQSANEVLVLAEGGTEKVTETLEGMSLLKQKVEAIAHQILRLEQQTNEIGSITNIVSDLANQTNMLALNAAVEAVRAGEQGKGFGVIATQIRQLADQSKTSTEKINHLIFNIQEAISMTVTVTEDGQRTADSSIQLSQETGEAFLKVARAIKEVILQNQQDSLEAISDVVVKSQQIAQSSQQQAIATSQVLDAMNSINQGAAQTATGIRETKQGIEKLNEAAMNLKQVI